MTVAITYDFNLSTMSAVITSENINQHPVLIFFLALLKDRTGKIVLEMILKINFRLCIFDVFDHFVLSSFAYTDVTIWTITTVMQLIDAVNF